MNYNFSSFHIFQMMFLYLPSLIPRKSMVQRNLLLLWKELVLNTKSGIDKYHKEININMIKQISQLSSTLNYLISWHGYHFISETGVVQSLSDVPLFVTPWTGFPVLHYLPKLDQTHVHLVSNAIQPSHPLSPPFSSCPQSDSATVSFPKSQLFALSGQSTGASASVLTMNIQGWFLYN